MGQRESFAPMGAGRGRGPWPARGGLGRAGLAATLAAGLLSAAGQAWAGSSAKGAVPASDKTFMAKAAQGGMAEVQLGQLAIQRGANAGVKSFGQRMVQDHSKANQELMGLAQRKGVTLPKDISKEDKAIYKKLAKLSGAAFDSSYMKDMVEDHTKDVAEFQKESQKGKDADVKAWAAKTMPTLQMHLQMAESTRKSSSGGSKMSGGKMH